MALYEINYVAILIPELEDGVKVKQFYHHVLSGFRTQYFYLKHWSSESYQFD